MEWQTGLLHTIVFYTEGSSRIKNEVVIISISWFYTGRKAGIFVVSRSPLKRRMKLLQRIAQELTI
jgi:hypothetical protein